MIDTETQAWIDSRPECIKKLMAEFEIGSTYIIEGRKFWLIGWGEPDHVLVSPVDPFEDHGGACANREAIHADCLRQALAAVEQKRGA